MSQSILPESLQVKYPQFARPVSKTQVHEALGAQERYIQAKIKYMAMLERVRKTSRLYRLFGENLEKMLNINGTLALNLRFINLENTRKSAVQFEKEKPVFQPTAQQQAESDFVSHLLGLNGGPVAEEAPVQKPQPPLMSSDPKSTWTAEQEGQLILKGDDLYLADGGKRANVFKYLLDFDRFVKSTPYVVAPTNVHQNLRRSLISANVFKAVWNVRGR